MSAPKAPVRKVRRHPVTLAVIFNDGGNRVHRAKQTPKPSAQIGRGSSFAGWSQFIKSHPYLILTPGPEVRTGPQALRGSVVRVDPGAVDFVLTERDGLKQKVVSMVRSGGKGVEVSNCRVPPVETESYMKALKKRGLVDVTTTPAGVGISIRPAAIAAVDMDDTHMTLTTRQGGERTEKVGLASPDNLRWSQNEQETLTDAFMRVGRRRHAPNRFVELQGAIQTDRLLVNPAALRRAAYQHGEFSYVPADACRGTPPKYFRTDETPELKRIVAAVRRKTARAKRA